MFVRNVPTLIRPDVMRSSGSVSGVSLCWESCFTRLTWLLALCSHDVRLMQLIGLTWKLLIGRVVFTMLNWPDEGCPQHHHVALTSLRAAVVDTDHCFQIVVVSNPILIFPGWSDHLVIFMPTKVSETVFISSLSTKTKTNTHFLEGISSLLWNADHDSTQ